ncbi:MAG: hypothetical protein ABIC19_02305 [Patescibacteria group bacterium]|nr:hypothetical protein [Patescibacteria group bacterium]
MQQLLKHTYLLNIDKIQADLERLWKRYQHILGNPSWNNLNEARAILYLAGQIYCEQIAVDAIERRLPLLKKPISLSQFLILIDSKSPKQKRYNKDPLFLKLKKFYTVIKKFKNKSVGGKYYLDEQRFIRLYNKHNPDRKCKMGYRGKIGK